MKSNKFTCSTFRNHAFSSDKIGQNYKCRNEIFIWNYCRICTCL